MRENGVPRHSPRTRFGDLTTFHSFSLLYNFTFLSLLLHCWVEQWDGDRASKFERRGLTERSWRREHIPSGRHSKSVTIKTHLDRLRSCLTPQFKVPFGRPQCSLWVSLRYLIRWNESIDKTTSWRLIYLIRYAMTARLHQKAQCWNYATCRPNSRSSTPISRYNICYSNTPTGTAV